MRSLLSTYQIGDNVTTDQDKKSTVKYWRQATLLSSLVAVVALLWGLSLNQQVKQLTNSLNTSLALATEANTKIQTLSKRDLPIILSFQKTFLTQELIATFRNLTSVDLEVAAVFTSPATNAQKDVNLVIPANGFIQFGKAQGWSFAAGQHIKLSNNEYRSLDYPVSN